MDTLGLTNILSFLMAPSMRIFMKWETHSSIGFWSELLASSRARLPLSASISTRASAMFSSRQAWCSGENPISSLSSCRQERRC